MLASCATSFAVQPVNIVIINLDDVGYGDLPTIKVNEIVGYNTD